MKAPHMQAQLCRCNEMVRLAQPTKTPRAAPAAAAPPPHVHKTAPLGMTDPRGPHARHRPMPVKGSPLLLLLPQASCAANIASCPQAHPPPARLKRSQAPSAQTLSNSQAPKGALTGA